jgi:hypothetical protein
MNSLRLIGLSIVLLFMAAHSLSAGHPPYVVLKTRPVAPQSHASSPGVAVTVEAQPYAYGWFGAQPRRHMTRHFGYYRNYTEWSAK